jgi:hypothetical protein
MQEEKLDTNKPEVDISSIFMNRNDGNLDEDDLHEEEKTDERLPSEEQRSKPDNTNEGTKPEDPKEEDKKVDGEEKEQSIDYQAELEKAERRYKDSQKWGTEMRKKLASYEKAIKKYADSGSLTTEEAEELLDHTKFEDGAIEDESPYVKYARIWDEGVERMREFADDPKEIDKYVHAFQQLLRDSTPAEQDEILDQFDEFEGNKASITRKMIKLGKEYYDETFGEVYESGSIRNFKKKFSEKEKKYNEKLDKLQKELDNYKSKYEDYTETTRLPTGGSDKSIDTKRYTTDVKEIYSMR